MEDNEAFELFVNALVESAMRALTVKNRHGYLYIDHAHPAWDFVWFCDWR